MKKNIVVFASGSGSNAKKIVEYFKESERAKVVGLVHNRKNAGVLVHAKQFKIPTFYCTNESFVEGEEILNLCQGLEVDCIVLAGFLRKIPNLLLKHYHNKIINIHPSLLPKYGGKGMYGHFVHEKVSESGDAVSGITIHLVNEAYDDGKILAQFSCSIVPNESAEMIAKKVLLLEHQYYATTIENYLF